MRINKRYSDEIINEYLDGELDAGTEKEIMLAALDDHDLRMHISELRQVRALVRQALAIDSAADVAGPDIITKYRTIIAGIAASTLLVVGVLIGWGLQPNASLDNVQAFIGPNSIKTAPQLVANHNSQDARAILHINSAEPRSMRIALDKAENMLKLYRNSGRVLRLEILVNAGGLNHFRQDMTPFLSRLALMQQEFTNLELLACNKSIKRLKRERHIDAKLVPGVTVIPSALDRILSRLNDGWSYIRV